MPHNNNSFMKSLFFGQILEELIFPYPKFSSDLTDSVQMILDSIDKFGKTHVRSKEWDEAGEMPREIVSELSALGVMGLAVPEELGGLGLPQSGYARIMEAVAGIDSSVAMTLGAHQSIGYKALLLFGTKEQKERFLPRLARGELIACYCLTEPGSGSDAASIKTKAELSPDGKFYTLTGNKIWITNGGIANFMTVFAKTAVEEKGEKKEKVTCFFLELPTDGVTVGPHESKLGIRASWTNAIYFDGVKVPVENIVGGLGYGFKVAMSVLNHGRLGLAAGCLGGAKRCIEASIEHAKSRVQFQKKIGEYGLIQEKIGQMMVDAFVTESMVYLTTALIDRKDIDYSLESAIAKIFASEMLWRTADETIQIWGGAGYMKEYPHERILRDARINRIFEGTNEILRAFIALSGMQGPGEVLSGVAEAIKYPLKGLGLVSDFAIRKIKQNLFGVNITKAHVTLKKMASMLEEYTVLFSSQVEAVLRKHGKQIFMKQFAQKRIADVAIDLYGMACVLSRVSTNLEEKGVAASLLELAIAESYFQQANRRIRNHFKCMNQNEDEYLKLIANKSYELGKYPFDVLTSSQGRVRA